MRLRGDPAPPGGASIGGFLLDEVISFDTTPPAPDCDVVPAPDPVATTTPAPAPAAPSPASPARSVVAHATFTG